MSDTVFAPPGRVLIIDDDPAILKCQALVLRQHGVSCHTGASAEEGLAILEAESIDAVLCDLHLPGLSGLDFLQALRADARFVHLPVAVVTGDLAPPVELFAAVKALRSQLVADILRRDALIALIESLLEQNMAR